MNEQFERLYTELAKAKKSGDDVKWNLITQQIAEIEEEGGL